MQKILKLRDLWDVAEAMNYSNSRFEKMINFQANRTSWLAFSTLLCVVGLLGMIDSEKKIRAQRNAELSDLQKEEIDLVTKLNREINYLEERVDELENKLKQKE